MTETLEKYHKILKILKDNAYQAYFVGGCVRDYLLGRAVYDVDIATDATPNELSALFFSWPKLDYTLKYGVLTIKGRYHCQISTFRQENSYTDNRHPDKIKFVKQAKIDAKRRDFTINALYMNENYKIYDYFDSIKDLYDKVIRMIGEPAIRISEDPLRIIRALRFADALGFTVDEKLEKAIRENLTDINKLKKEKIKEEIAKYKEKKHYFDKYLAKIV